jgi:hypothetical protein
VEAVIDVRSPLRLPKAFLEGFHQGLPGVEGLYKIDDGSGTAKSCGPRAGFPGIAGDGRSRRHFDMDMRIYPAGEDQHPQSRYQLSTCEVWSQLNNLSPYYANISLENTGARNHRAVVDDEIIHRFYSPT